MDFYKNQILVNILIILFIIFSCSLALYGRHLCVKKKDQEYQVII